MTRSRAAFTLSLAFPGAGFLYLGQPVFALVAGGAVLWAACAVRSMSLAVLAHVLGAFAASIAAREAESAEMRDRDPDEARDGSATRSAEGPSLHAELLAVGPTDPPLDADRFLSELRSAWSSYRAGEMDGGQFAERKRAMIARISLEDDDEARALVAAVTELRGAGVVSFGEREAVRAAAGRSAP